MTVDDRKEAQRIINTMNMLEHKKDDYKKKEQKSLKEQAK
jgi:hypothetical protein